MAWVTMHWTLFAEPGWTVATCATPRCKLNGGGDYAVLVSPDGRDVTVIVETFLHSASQCIRQAGTGRFSIVSLSIDRVLPHAAVIHGRRRSRFCSQQPPQYA